MAMMMLMMMMMTMNDGDGRDGDADGNQDDGGGAIVAMMVLLDQGKYSVNEPVAKYLPEFADLMCRPDDEDADLYPCENALLIEHLLTHRSGYSY